MFKWLNKEGLVWQIVQIRTLAVFLFVVYVSGEINLKMYWTKQAEDVE